MNSSDEMFGVYQGWVHQNTGIHLDVRIDEDGKWQARLIFKCTQRYNVLNGRVGNFFVLALMAELGGIQQ